MAKRATGVVKWFNVTKGFGFITPDESGDDLFVHQSSIKSDGYRSLAEGESVEYEIETGSDGKTKAVDVTGPGGSNVRGAARSGGGGDDYSRGSRGGDYGGGDDYSRGGRSGGGNGYGGGRSGGSECYNCGGSGHMSRDCSEPRGGGGGRSGGSECYNCKQVGHMARDCPEADRRGGGGGGGGGGGACYSCGEQGHMSRDCPGGSGGGGGGYGGGSGGYGGGGYGGNSGGGRGGGGGGGCFTCGESGHFARECPSKGN